MEKKCVHGNIIYILLYIMIMIIMIIYDYYIGRLRESKGSVRDFSTLNVAATLSCAWWGLGL